MAKSQDYQSSKKTNRKLHFSHLNVSSGLSHDVVNDIAQDSLGFIWIASYDGLNRYDGDSFLHYKMALGNQSEGLVNNFVQKIYATTDSLYIGTDGGLNIYNLRKDEFTLVDEKKGLLSNGVSVLKKINDSLLAICTYRGGIQFLDNKKNLKSFKDYTGKALNLSSTEISSMAVHGDSIMWVGTSEGLNKLDIRNGTSITFTRDSNPSINSDIINTIFKDSFGNLWVGTTDGIVFIRNENGFNNFQNITVSSGLSDSDILSFEEDDFGYLWIGTRNGGLNTININSVTTETDNFEIVRYTPKSDGQSVFSRTISSIFKDTDGNMWLGTPTGINFVNPRGENIKLLKHNYSDPLTISHDRIGFLANANDNLVWVGTDGGGMDLLDVDKGVIDHFEHIDGDPSSLSNDYILAILQESSTRVWVGTYRGGINLLNPKTRTSKHYLQTSIVGGSDVRTIFKSKTGVLWVGTNRGGLYKFNDAEDRFEYVEELGKIDIRDISEDKVGNLWVATYGNGIIRYSPSSFELIEYNQSNLPGLKSNVVFAILTLENGDVLAGTRYGGLVKLSPDSNKLISYSEKDGLSNNTVNSLVQEDSVHIWMGTYTGINAYNLHTDEILNITNTSNNIQEGEFNTAAIKNEDDYLFFGGNNGLNYFKPDEFTNLEDKYPIRFKGLKILNENITVEKNLKNGVLKETLLFQDEIVLDYDQNSFSIDFVALKYPENKNTEYWYKLENYNEFWIETQNVSLVNFTEVPPGEYNFIVKTANDLESENSRALKITIVPPFWKTTPAYLLYLLLLSLAIWIIAKYYSERIKLKNSLLFEQKQRALEHDLNEERFRFFTAFSHELKTPLTLILAPIENLLAVEQKKEIKRNLAYVHRNAKKLYKSIDTLLKFRKTEEGLSQLNIDSHDLPARLRKWVNAYIPLSKEKGINLEYNGPVGSKIFKIDLEKIEVIVDNLLSNAIKYSNRGGSIKVSFTNDEDGFKIEVRDNGKGIPPEELSHIFDWYYRSNSTMNKNGTGIGLALAQSFAQIHGGTITAKNNLPDGTIFILECPIPELKLQIGNINEEYDSLISRTYKIPRLDIQNPKINSLENRKLILLIDDNEEILGFLAGILKKHFDIIHAINGLEGVEKAKKFIPDLIISDVMMPEKSGFDLCTELKGNFATSHIPIILLTADTSIESMKEGFEEGADEYITKPFNTNLLLTRVNNLLVSREMLRKSYSLANSTVKNDVLNKESRLLDKEKKFLEKLDTIIIKRMGETTDNVEEIAHEVGMSRTSLYRKLKAITDSSINEYIRNLKIEKAADMIKYQNYSVSQASYEVGFNDTKYFRKIFKERFGKNPSEHKS